MFEGFKSLPRNAKACIATEPLWALFAPTTIYFMPLFQKQLGLSELQMGSLNSVNIAAGLVFYLFAAPLTNKLGRRTTSFIFDFAAWTVPMLLWAMARSYAWFLFATIFNAVVRIIYVSWNLLLSEDASEAQRPAIFGYINAIGSLGGVTTLAGGFLIQKYGVEPAMRGLFWGGAASISALFIIRYIYSRETKVGEFMMAKAKGESLLRLVARQLPGALEAMKEPFFRRMTGIYFIGNAILSIDFFRVLYLKDVKALSSLTVSLLPALGAALSFIVFFVILPRRKGQKDKKSLASAFLACLLAQLLFMLMPKGSAAAAILVFPALQASVALFQTFRDTVFMNGTEAELKSDRFSLIQILMMFFSIPMGALAGFLYSLDPRLPFALASALYLAGFFLARSVQRLRASS
jgi:MFS family permease